MNPAVQGTKFDKYMFNKEKHKAIFQEDEEYKKLDKKYNGDIAKIMNERKRKYIKTQDTSSCKNHFATKRSYMIRDQQISMLYALKSKLPFSDLSDIVSAAIKQYYLLNINNVSDSDIKILLDS